MSEISRRSDIYLMDRTCNSWSKPSQRWRLFAIEPVYIHWGSIHLIPIHTFQKCMPAPIQRRLGYSHSLDIFPGHLGISSISLCRTWVLLAFLFYLFEPAWKYWLNADILNQTELNWRHFDPIMLNQYCLLENRAPLNRAFHWPNGNRFIERPKQLHHSWCLPGQLARNENCGQLPSLDLLSK